MKTTVEIADDLFHRVQKLARDEKTTFRALTEEGLRRMLEQKQDENLEKKQQAEKKQKQNENPIRKKKENPQWNS